MTAKNNRIDSLQAIRAMAFLGVFLYHAVKTFPGDGAIYHYFAKSPGPWGVSVFFCLSGFLMTYAYWNRAPRCSLKDSVLFSFKKIKRLYPLHLIMLVFGVIFLLLRHRDVMKIVMKLLITIPLVQTWFPQDFQAINTVAWYLSVCLFLYFCFPLILKLVLKQHSVKSSVIIMIAVFALQLLAGFLFYNFTEISVRWITYCHPLFRLGDFIIGCQLAAIYQNRAAKQVAVWKCSVMEIVAILLNIAVCIFYTLSSYSTIWFRCTCLFIPASVLLVYAFALDNGVISKVLKNKVVFWLAMISPYAYLIHRLVINYFHLFVQNVLQREELNFFFVIVVPFAITVLFVYLYLFVEKKITNRKGKKTCKNAK